MSENTENKRESLTIKEISKQVFDNHMEQLKERVNRYDELKKDDIKIEFLYLHFKPFLGDIGYMLSYSNPVVKDHLLSEFIKEIAREIDMSLKFGDDIKIRYLMEKYVLIVKKLFEEAAWDIKLDKPRPLPSLKVELEPKLPIFICFECEKKYPPRDSFERMRG